MNPVSIAPVFHVTDIVAAVRFYTEVLGFEEEFRVGSYVGLKFGGAQLHLATAGGDYARKAGGGTVYIFCDTVDEYFDAIVSRGAVPSSEPKDAAYGLRDFVVHDTDGNQVSFGAELVGLTDTK